MRKKILEDPKEDKEVELIPKRKNNEGISPRLIKFDKKMISSEEASVSCM
jgi:hypothetical protein